MCPPCLPEQLLELGVACNDAGDQCGLIPVALQDVEGARGTLGRIDQDAVRPCKRLGRGGQVQCAFEHGHRLGVTLGADEHAREQAVAGQNVGRDRNGPSWIRLALLIILERLLHPHAQAQRKGIGTTVDKRTIKQKEWGLVHL
jgi:hypothetical protein